LSSCTKTLQHHGFFDERLQVFSVQTTIIQVEVRRLSLKELWAERQKKKKSTRWLMNVERISDYSLHTIHGSKIVFFFALRGLRWRAVDHGHGAIKLRLIYMASAYTKI
jgi:hypothetical protein